MEEKSNKLTLKRVEIPLNKFNDVAIPYHLNLLQKHKTNIQRYQFHHDWEKIRVEQTNAQRVVRQLKQLLYEMDTLRAQVQNSDLQKFDECTLKSRETIQRVIKDYLELTSLKNQLPYDDEINSNTEDDIHSNDMDQIQLQTESLDRREAYLHSTEALQNEIKDLHTVFAELGQMVEEQGELVNNIDQNVETAQNNIQSGVSQLSRAAKLKAATFPLTGAIVGTCLGGPIGFIAGLKFGGLAALSCGIIGYTGGCFLQKKTTEPDSKNRINENLLNDKKSAL